MGISAEAAVWGHFSDLLLSAGPEMPTNWHRGLCWWLFPSLSHSSLLGFGQGGERGITEDPNPSSSARLKVRLHCWDFGVFRRLDFISRTFGAGTILILFSFLHFVGVLGFPCLTALCVFWISPGFCDPWWFLFCGREMCGKTTLSVVFLLLLLF